MFLSLEYLDDILVANDSIIKLLIFLIIYEIKIDY